MAPATKITANQEGKAPKKKFNKRQWREQQYSHKEKVNEWQERRKLAIERDYKKMLKKEGIQTQPNPPNNPVSEPSNIAASPDELEARNSCGNDVVKPEIERPGRLSAYQRAKQAFEKKEEEKKNRSELIALRKAEKEEAIKKYKQRKLDRFKKISQKTRKGQPVMKGRIELLLAKIQKQVNS